MKESSDGSIALSLRLVKANELARQDRIKEAKDLLAPDGQPPEDSVALETLAALVTREGDYIRALHLWQTLLRREPRHAEALRLIAALEVWMARPPWFQFLPLAAGAALLLVLASAWWALAGRHPAPENTASPMVAVPTLIRPVNNATPATASPTSAPAAAKPKEDAPAVKFQLAPTTRPKK